MIPQTFFDAKLIQSTQIEMSEQAKLYYLMAAQDLQKHITNSIISNRNIDFYLKRTFEGDGVLNYYNFYKETDATKLKVFIENMIKKISEKEVLSEQSQEQTYEEQPSRLSANKTYIDNEQLKKFADLELQLKSTLHSLRITKSSELEVLNQIVRNLKQYPQLSKTKNDIEFLLAENENCINLVDGIVNDLENINQNYKIESKDFIKDDLELTHEKQSLKTRPTEDKLEKGSSAKKLIEHQISSLLQSSRGSESNIKPRKSEESTKTEMQSPEIQEIVKLLASSDQSTLRTVIKTLKYPTATQTEATTFDKRQSESSFGDRKSVFSTQAEETIANLKKEKFNLERELREREEEIERIRKSYHSTEEVEELINNFKREKLNLERDLREKTDELERWKKNYQNTPTQEEIIASLKREKSNLERELREKNDELEKRKKSLLQVGDLEDQISQLKRDKSNLEWEIKELNEEMERRRRQHAIEKEAIDKKLYDLTQENEYTKQLYHTEKDAYERQLAQKTEELDRIRKQTIIDKEKMLVQLKEAEKTAERKAIELEDYKRQMSAERERTNKKIRELEQMLDNSREELAKRLREKDEELEAQKNMLMQTFKEKCDEWENNTENITAKMKEKFNEVEKSKELLREELMARTKEYEKNIEYYEKKIAEKNDELQENKEYLLKEIQESNQIKEKLNSIILENMELNKKLLDALREKEELDLLLHESNQRHKNDQDALIKELANFEVRQEREMKELNGKIAELENYVTRLKKQNDQLKTDNQRLADLLDAENKKKEFGRYDFNQSYSYEGRKYDDLKTQ